MPVLPLLLFLFIFSCSTDKQESVIKEEEQQQEVIEEPIIETPNTDPVVGTEWELIFEENFDTDLSKWKIWEWGAYNNEIQLYQQEQLELKDGILHISAERKAVTGPTYFYDDTPKEFEYVSGRIETKELFGPSDEQGELEYRFMAHIQIPSGDGMWPAFWSTSDPWPTNGEIDILEARGNEPMTYQSNFFYGPTHNVAITKNEDTEKIFVLDVDITKDFHTYELIWRENSLEVLFDGETMHTYNADSKNYIATLFGKKQNMILNLAVGGGFFYNNPDSATYADNGVMKIDWVRAYKR